MNARLKILVLMMVAIMAAVGLTGCAGKQARELAAVTIDMADTGVEQDVRRGIDLIESEDVDDTFNFSAAHFNADTFFTATSSRSRWDLATVALPLWPEMRGYAEQGFEIDVGNGDLGVGVRMSLVERLNQFEDNLTKASQGAEPPDP